MCPVSLVREAAWFSEKRRDIAINHSLNISSAIYYTSYVTSPKLMNFSDPRFHICTVGNDTCHTRCHKELRKHVLMSSAVSVWSMGVQNMVIIRLDLSFSEADLSQG